MTRIWFWMAIVSMLCGISAGPGRAQQPVFGAIEGRVQTADRQPVANATVKLETGQSSVTNAEGSFRLDAVAPGRHTARIEARGFKPATGTVTVQSGQTRTLLVETRALGAAGSSAKTKPVRRGTLAIHAYTKAYSGKRAYVSKIEVWEQGNRNHIWTQTWWSDSGETYRYLSCPGAIVGKTYKIAIQWKTKSGGTRYGTWIKQLWSSSQTESFYRP